jgi:uncharacterized protein (DUF427 family)
MMKAIWNNTIIAESEDTIVVENNHYFPPSAVHMKYFRESDTHSVCPWKGTASYYDVVIDGKENRDAAWYYPDTKKMADPFKDYVAFWKGVAVVK